MALLYLMYFGDVFRARLPVMKVLREGGVSLLLLLLLLLLGTHPLAGVLSQGDAVSGKRHKKT